MITKLKFFLVSFCLLAFFGRALANVAPDPLNQGITPARKDYRVQMVSEDVVVHLDSDWCRVEANFLLYNRSFSPASMEVGFPTGYKDEVKRLKVWKNGKRVKTRKVTEKEIMDPDGDPAVYHWVLWNMRFAPLEKTSLKVTYSVKPRRNHDYLITFYRISLEGIKKDAAEHKQIPAAVRQVLDGIISYSTGYIMMTGANWYDPIERATITVKHPNGAGAVRWLKPAKNFTVVPEGIRWEFSHIKPDFDVQVEFHGGWNLEEEIAVVKRAIEASDKNAALKEHLLYLEQMKKCLETGNCQE